MRRIWFHCATMVASTVLALLATGRASALDFYVDGAAGNDARTVIEAQSPATPWATITHALLTVTSGHTVHVKPGTYNESPQTKYDGVTLIAEGPARSVVISPPAGTAALAVVNHDWTVTGFVFQGGVHGIRASGADGLDVRGCIAVGQAANAFSVVATAGATIENSRAISAGSRGILADHSSSVYLRNNLIYGNGEWGVSFENTNRLD